MDGYEMYQEMLRQDKAEYERKQSLINFCQEVNQNTEGIFMILKIGQYKSMPYLLDGQGGMACSSRELTNIRSQSIRLIEVIDNLIQHPEYNAEQFDSTIYEAWQLYQEHLQFERLRQPKPPKKLKATTVYVMHNTQSGYYKIGCSKTPTVRERTLQSQEPTIELIATYPGSYQNEKELHEHFADKRIRGEWFTLSPSDIDWINRYFLF
jgi:hypothetical protein